MQNRLDTFFRNINRKGKTGTTVQPNIHIVDWKNYVRGGEVEILNKPDPRIKSVILINEPSLEVYYCIFAESSFKKENYNIKGKLIGFLNNYYRQCECMLSPNNIRENENCWILLLETKYAENYAAASSNNYPQSMIEQIIQTSEYLRRHGIISENKRIHALVSFPNVIEDFNSTLFNGNVFDDGTGELDITEIVIKYKVVIKAQNYGIIKSDTRLKFT